MNRDSGRNNASPTCSSPIIPPCGCGWAAVTFPSSTAATMSSRCSGPASASRHWQGSRDRRRRLAFRSVATSFALMAPLASSSASLSAPSTWTTRHHPKTAANGTEMADITLNFVNSYRDPRNGKWRHQFRRKGCRKVMLKGRPGSAEFMDHYAELLAQSENAAALIGASKIKPGTIDAVVVNYLRNDAFTKGLAKATQATRRPILDNFRQFKTPSGR